MVIVNDLTYEAYTNVPTVKRKNSYGTEGLIRMSNSIILGGIVVLKCTHIIDALLRNLSAVH